MVNGHGSRNRAAATADGRPPRRGRPGYDLESLLAVAVTVFDERGYDGTSMEDLSQRLGISKSSIYYHVDSKEQLLALALDRALDGLFSVADEVLAAGGISPIERLELLVRGSVRVLADELPYVTLLLRARGNTVTEQRALARRRDFDRIVADLVGQAEQDGDIRPDVDPAITARLLFGLVNSLVEWYRPGRHDAPVSGPTEPTGRTGTAGTTGTTAGNPRTQGPAGTAGTTDASELADAVCAVAFDGLRVRRAEAAASVPVPAGLTTRAAAR